MSRFFVIFFTKSVKFFTNSIEIYYKRGGEFNITNLVINSDI